VPVVDYTQEEQTCAVRSVASPHFGARRPHHGMRACTAPLAARGWKWGARELAQVR